jgi:hypothetical protein
MEFLDRYGLRSDGTKTSASEPGAALVERYLAEGGRIDETILPPDGFNAAEASDETLELFGVPQRPSTKEGLAEWMRTWNRKMTRPASAGPPCVSSDRGESLESPSWAGRLARSFGFNNVVGTFTVPTFAYACPHLSAHLIFVGIGGWFSDSAGLLQAGIDTSRTDMSVHPFTEVWPLQGIVDRQYPAISIGNSVTVRTRYDNGTARWTITNNTTGQYASYSLPDISAYYDSRTAEWIDERPSGVNLQYPVDGDKYYYRKTTGPTYWSGQMGNGYSAGSFRPAGIYMYSDSYATVLATAGLPSSTTSYHPWWHCPGE